MKLIIDRAKWIRGQETGSLLLRKEDGCQCCIGMLLLQNGVAEEAICNIDAAAKIPKHIPEALRWLLEKSPHQPDLLSVNWVNSRRAYEFYGQNDDPTISEVTREKTLKEMFAEHGIEVEFIN